MRRDDICIYVSPANGARLKAIIADRNSLAKHVWRAEIVLATADGHGTNEIMRLPTAGQRIWAEAGPKPHLVKRFKISNDPHFEEKVTDVVRLYMKPADRALVLCVDEKCCWHDGGT